MALHMSDLAISIVVGGVILAGGFAVMQDLREVAAERTDEMTDLIGDKEGTKGVSKRLKDAITALGTTNDSD